MAYAVVVGYHHTLRWKYPQYECSVNYAVRDWDSTDDNLPREETGSDGDEDV